MIYIVTVATQDKLYFRSLEESCRRNGISLTVLGFGQRWKGFGQKYELLSTFLETLDDEDIVCFVDGYDVICVRHLGTFIDTFWKIKHREKCRLIVGHDKFIRHIDSIIPKYYFGKCQNTYHLNSGTYIGIVRDIRHVLSKFHFHDSSDDQVLMIQYCNLFPQDIYIDLKNELFLSIFVGIGVDITKDPHFQWSRDKKEIWYKGQQPYFIHAPNNGLLDTILQTMGYLSFDPQKIQSEIYKYRGRRIFIEYIQPSWWMSILLLILVVLLTVHCIRQCSV